MKKMSEKLNQIKWHSSRKIYIYIKNHSPPPFPCLGYVAKSSSWNRK